MRSERSAASIQVRAICSKISRSRSDFAVRAQSKHSLANVRYSSTDMSVRLYANVSPLIIARSIAPNVKWVKATYPPDIASRGRPCRTIQRDAVCSSSDEGHDALMEIYHRRYTEQIEVADANTIVARWGD
jgi:hypothetical protein